MIQRNLNPAGRLYNMLFGVACVVDGLVRLLSLGFAHTRLPSQVSRRGVLKQISKMKRDR